MTVTAVPKAGTYTLDQVNEILARDARDHREELARIEAAHKGALARERKHVEDRQRIILEQQIEITKLRERNYNVERRLYEKMREFVVD